MPTAVVLCLPVRETTAGTEVLLGLKLRGFGKGRLVAPGGKIEPGETPAEAAARELGEETGLAAAARELAPVGRVFFRFPSRPASDMDCSVFIARTFHGEPAVSEELHPEWHAASRLPAGRMWDDSVRWLPRLLSGERFDATVVLAPDNESVRSFSTSPWTPGDVPAAIGARREARPAGG